MEWYNSLNIHERINAKECFVLVCGVEWDKLSFILSIKERINVMYESLKREGFEL